VAGSDDTASAPERAYRAIRDEILDGTHRPGTMLGETALAAALGMSRTPVRTALARLSDEGWIVVYPKRGALVQGLSERAIAELADARFVLETTGVDRAPEVRRAELATTLEKVIVDQRKALARKDVQRFITLTLQFHRGFVEAGGNGILLELYDRLSDRHRFALFAARDRLLGRSMDILAEHQELVTHLREGDVSAFARTLRGHIAEVGDTIPALLNHL